MMENVQTETPSKLAKLAKCAHESCTCTVSSGEQFCSDFCASMAGDDQATAGDGCGCGHAECAGAEAEGWAPVTSGIA
jgi:hypothetical protein